MTLILKSVEEEAEDCRARCAGLKVGDLALHIHHEIWMEPLFEPIENRIQFILKTKVDNVALRLRLLSPLKEDEESKADTAKAYAELSKASAELSKARDEYWKASAELSKADAEYEKASDEFWKTYEKHYRRLFPDSPWDGKTIFAGVFAEENNYGI